MYIDLSYVHVVQMRSVTRGGAKALAEGDKSKQQQVLVKTVMKTVMMMSLRERWTLRLIFSWSKQQHRSARQQNKSSQAASKVRRRAKQMRMPHLRMMDTIMRCTLTLLMKMKKVKLSVCLSVCLSV